MTNQFSPERLRQNFKACKRVKKTPAFGTDGATYLYKRFFLPLLHQKPVKFGNLDYTRFEIDDILEISRFYNDFEHGISEFLQMYRKLTETNAATKPVVFI